jgi:uncharacterized protein (DUF433 family)
LVTFLGQGDGPSRVEARLGPVTNAIIELNFTLLRGYAVARPLDRITANPAIMNGQPCLRGMRLTVRRVVEAVALYPDRNELKAEYPELEDEDIAQALEFAARSLDDQILPLEAA